MSNILSRNPIYLDTALQSYKASVASVQGTRLELIVLKIRWVAPNAGDVLEFVDPQSGNVLAMMSAKTAGQDVEEDFSRAPRIWADFGVPSVSSGKVFLYTR